MRSTIAKGNSGLTYEIRNIVLVAEQLKKNNIEVTWENIGDPVNKGEIIPDWMKEIVKKSSLTERKLRLFPHKRGIIYKRIPCR